MRNPLSVVSLSYLLFSAKALTTPSSIPSSQNLHRVSRQNNIAGFKPYRRPMHPVLEPILPHQGSSLLQSIYRKKRFLVEGTRTNRRSNPTFVKPNRRGNRFTLHQCKVMDASMLDTAPMNEYMLESGIMGIGTTEDEAAEVERFKQQVDEVGTKVDELELRVKEVSKFYSSSSKKQLNTSKCSSIMKDRDKDKQIVSNKKQQDAARREVAHTKRMQELIRQFSTILRQITQHKWAWPFMQPVDVKGLNLHDYYEVIEKPMDFGTIRNQMEAKDGTGYNNVREIYADVRLVFKNAMTYNDERNDVHVMAKTLLDKFEEKWLLLLPKVIEEETRRKEEEAEANSDMQIAQEDATAKIARDISTELHEINLHLEELRETVVQKCRKMSTEEKRKLGSGLSRLSTEDLNKALEIVAKTNPSFQATAEEVDLDMDAQSESTLWRLKFFVKEALEAQARSSAIKGQETSKRKRDQMVRDAVLKSMKSVKKRNKKLPS